MKKRVEIIDGDKVTITDDNLYLSEDLPDDLDFSSLKEIDNPLKYMVILDEDVARFFKNPKKLMNT